MARTSVGGFVLIVLVPLVRSQRCDGSRRSLAREMNPAQIGTPVVAARRRRRANATFTGYLGLVGKARATLLQRIGGKTPVLADSDDLFSAGCVALVKAADEHDGRSSFATFAWRCIWAAMIDELRKHGPIKRNGERRPKCLSFSAELRVSDNGAPLTLADIVPARDASVEEQVEAREALAAVYELPPLRREALLRRGIGESLEEIAESWGVTPGRVSQIITDYRKSA